MAPAYTVAESAHYLSIPKATLRAWVAGQGNFRRVLRIPPHDGPPLLSFVTLVEAHVLDALRRVHRVPLPRVRKAIRFMTTLWPDKAHPLAEVDIQTDGLDVLVGHWGNLLNASRDGQYEIRMVLEAHVRRVERDPSGAAVRLFPFTRKRDIGGRLDSLDEPRAVVIDPAVSFGRPILVGTGIPTGVIAERYKAGESMEELAEDYGRKPLEIQEAIRCELKAA